MTSKNFLAKLRKDKGLTQGALAKESGVSRSVIAQIEINKNNPSPETAAALAKVLGVSASMLENVIDVVADDAKPTWAKPGDGIPYYDVDFFAGEVEVFNDGPEVPADYLKIPGAEDCDFSCRVSGKSMYDKIHPGAIIACKEVRDKSIIAFGEIHLIVTREKRLIKYIRRHPSDKSMVILRSHNPDHDDIDVPIDKILRLMEVKFIINQEQM